MSLALTSRWHRLVIAPVVLVMAIQVGVVSRLTVAAAAGQTLFVSPSGIDTGQCHSQSQPCRTIGYALGQASAGDTVKLAGGIFSERPLIAQSISIVGSGASATAIDGGGAGTTVTVISASATVVLSNLTVGVATPSSGAGPQPSRPISPSPG